MKSTILNILNDDIFGMGRPIDFVFDSMVGFWGTADHIELLLVASNPKWRPVQDGAQLPSWKFQMMISLERLIQSISCRCQANHRIVRLQSN